MTPRILPLPADQRTPDQQALIEATGTELNIFTTLVRHPKLFEVFGRFAGRLLRRSGLPEHIREALILRTAYRCRAPYEWAQHHEIARAIGMPDEVITAIGTDEPDLTDPLLALAIKAADQLTTRRTLDDDTWASLREHYDDAQLIELCMLVGNYAMIAGVLNALRVPLEDGQQPPAWYEVP